MPETIVFPQAPDLRVSRLGFGCASLMRVTSARERLHLLDSAFGQGLRHFDVARMYGLGAVESEVGRFARGRDRDQLTIATKFGIDPARGLQRLGRLQQPARELLNRVPSARQAVKRRSSAAMSSRRYDLAIAQRSFDRSLRELDLDYVDILFIHDPSPGDDIRSAELVAFFEAQRAAGKLRAWGVSQDAHPGLNVVGSLGPSAILQIRETIFDTERTSGPRMTFGVLGAPHERLAARLQSDPGLRHHWSDRLGADPLVGDTLARLLLADALDANPGGTVLFSTIRANRLPVAASVLADPPSFEMLTGFRDLAGARSSAVPA